MKDVSRRRGVVVTRPDGDAEFLVEALSKRGWTPLRAPMLRIRRVADDVPALRSHPPPQALAATSANAIAVLREIDRENPLPPDARRIPVLAVGEASADAARDFGFKNVRAAEGSLESLRRLARKAADPDRGRIVYPSGRAVSGDLAAELRKDGFKVDRVALYDAVPVGRLPEETVRAVRDGDVFAAAIFSPRSAALWSREVRRAGLAERVRTVEHWLLAESARKELDPMPDVIRVARAPSTDAMLKLVPSPA